MEKDNKQADLIKMKKLVIHYERQLKLLDRKLREEKRKNKLQSTELVQLKTLISRMQSTIRNI